MPEFLTLKSHPLKGNSIGTAVGGKLGEMYPPAKRRRNKTQKIPTRDYMEGVNVLFLALAEFKLYNMLCWFCLRMDTPADGHTLVPGVTLSLTEQQGGRIAPALSLLATRGSSQS